jgi:SAM-dependent methyltransferase
MTFDEQWLDYWNGDVSLYVSPRHLKAHYQRLFTDIQPLLPDPPFTLLDYGCGDALMAPMLAKAGGRILLYDLAPSRRVALRQRFAHEERIEVQNDLEGVQGACDIVLLISVIQYVTRENLPGLLRSLGRCLKPGGLLVIGDILSPSNNMVTDVGALLRFGLAEGFFTDAVTGLVKTFRSDYRKMRGKLGLTVHTVEAIVGLLGQCGFHALPLTRNIGHARHRRTVMAKLADGSLTRHEEE